MSVKGTSMTNTGSGPPGDDPNKRFIKFVSGCRDQKPLKWSPKKINPLPGGKRSVATLLTWHSNSQVLSAHVLRYSKTPLAWLVYGAVGAGVEWYKYSQNNKNAETERQLRELEVQSKRAIENAAARIQQLERDNQSLRDENKSWLNLKSWFK